VLQMAIAKGIAVTQVHMAKEKWAGSSSGGGIGGAKPMTPPR